MASNPDRERVLARKGINLVLTRVSGIFRASTSFAYPDRFSAPLGARKCLSPINTKRQRVECFRRNEEGLWVLQFYTPKQALFRLESVGFEATLEALYEDVTFA